MGGSTCFGGMDTDVSDSHALLSIILPGGTPYSGGPAGENYIQDRFSTLLLFNGDSVTGLPPLVNDQAITSPGGLELVSPSQRISSFVLQTRSLLGHVLGQAREDIVSPTIIGGSFTLPRATNSNSSLNETRVHPRDPLVNIFYHSGNKDIFMG